MAQFLRPNADVTTTGVVAGTFASIDEVTADDITTWIATDDNVAATYECALTDPSTPISGTCTARVRVALADGGAPTGALGNSITIDAYVYQGASLIATIGSVTQPTTWTTLSNTFDASLVTDWTDVRIRFVCNASGGSPANRRGMSITWAEIETPDAGGGVNHEVTVTGVTAGTPSVGTPTVEEAGLPTWDGTGLWTPSELANTIPLWMDAYDPTTLTLSGSAVTQWRSKTGSITLDQATGSKQPTYSATARNGLPGIIADGGDILPLSATTDFVTGATESRYVAVARNNSATGYRYILSVGDMDGSADRRSRQLGIQNSSPGIALCDNYGAGISTGGGWTSDKIAIARIVDSTYGIKVDGNSEVTGINGTGAHNSVTTRGKVFGNARTADEQFWNGELQELIVINGSMTTGEVEQLEGYLAHKWGLAALLPSGHPYKSAAPTSSTADHPVTANGIATGAPSTGSPALAQDHALAGSSVSTGTPSTGTPTLAQDHALAGTTIAASTPTVGTPALAQDHALGGLVGIAAGTPSIGTPSLSQAHQLAGTGIATGAPSVGTTAIGQDHAAAPLAIATGTPSVGAPALAQDHAFAATGVATGAPSVGSATLAAAGDESVTPTGVTTGTPTVGTPGLTQNHAFEPIAVAAGTPSIGIPGLSQSHALSAPAISAGQPTVGTPGLLQQHAATVTGVTAGAPSTGSPTMQQDHALAPVGVTAGTPLVGLMPLEGEVAVLDELLAGMMVNPGTLTRR